MRSRGNVLAILSGNDDFHNDEVFEKLKTITGASHQCIETKYEYSTHPPPPPLKKKELQQTFRNTRKVGAMLLFVYFVPICKNSVYSRRKKKIVYYSAKKQRLGGLAYQFYPENT